jgi:hypothetical protein
MNDTGITTASLDQTDEEIFTTSVSDEALEAAAGTGHGGPTGGPEAHTYCC